MIPTSHDGRASGASNGEAQKQGHTDDVLGQLQMPSVQITRGENLWREFCRKTKLDYYHDGVVALFDQHNVVDTLGEQESMELGVTLGHIDNVNTYL